MKLKGYLKLRLLLSIYWDESSADGVVWVNDCIRKFPPYIIRPMISYCLWSCTNERYKLEDLVLTEANKYIQWVITFWAYLSFIKAVRSSTLILQFYNFKMVFHRESLHIVFHALSSHTTQFLGPIILFIYTFLKK